MRYQCIPRFVRTHVPEAANYATHHVPLVSGLIIICTVVDIRCFEEFCGQPLAASMTLQLLGLFTKACRHYLHLLQIS
jgi:hypothetical protein